MEGNNGRHCSFSSLSRSFKTDTVWKQKTAAYHSFPNIRYASAPVGDLRWKAPVPPQTNRSVIQSNAQSIECAQGSPSWQIRTAKYIRNYLKTGNIANVTYSDLSTFSGGVEDCLFLDVMAPRKVFHSVLANGTLAPVLVWIHGGGFTAGSKTSFGSVLGLINRSQMNGSSGVVYVALNYRLGAFRFMSGPAFEERIDNNTTKKLDALSLV